jgi:hypothetical protein
VRARALVAALALALLAVGFALRPPPTEGPALRDFESYYAAGATWRYHGDPYGRDVWRVERTIQGVGHDELLPFVGPPSGLPLWELLARLDWPAACVVWGALLAFALAALAFGSLRLAGGTIDLTDAVAILIFCAGFGPLTSGLALGQVAILSCAAIVVTPLLLGPRLVFAAAASTLVATLQPNLAIALLARASGRRAPIAFALAAAIALGGSALAIAQEGGLGHYLAVLREHAAAERFIAIQTTVAAVVRALGATPSLTGGIALGAALATLGALALQLLSRRYAPDDRLALACAALPLALPFAHEHDFTLAFLPAIVVTRRARGALWVAAAISSLVIATDWLGLAQRPPGLAMSTAFACAAALGLTALARERLQPFHFLPALLALAVAAVGTLAAAHPLPTWPVNLPPAFAMPAGPSAAVVWNAEQIASGIGALDPRWALLRLFSLAGCASLWAIASVVLLTSRRRARDLEPRSEPSSTPRQEPQATCPSS